MRRRLALGAALLLVLPSGCDVFAPSCGGAEALDPVHAAVLECAGWLDYVEQNVSTIDYIDAAEFASPTDPTVIGTATCGRCAIAIATKRPLLEVLGTIVHEATHLEDECDNGEYPAIFNQQQFVLDYRDNSCFDLPSR
ncbi:MAG: hypothetical protein AAGJ10_15650 [Bacteroidota bacterium]